MVVRICQRPYRLHSKRQRAFWLVVRDLPLAGIRHFAAMSWLESWKITTRVRSQHQIQCTIHHVIMLDCVAQATKTLSGAVTTIATRTMRRTTITVTRLTAARTVRDTGRRLVMLFSL